MTERVNTFYLLQKESPMTTLSIILLVIAVTGLTLATHYLDARYNLRLADWMGGNGNPFQARAQQSISNKEKAAYETQIAALTERVQVLEAIVTEPSYTLKKEIEALKDR